MQTRSFILLVLLLLANALVRPAAAQVIRGNISFGYPPRAYYGPRYYAPPPPVVYALPPPPVVVVPDPYYAPRPGYYAPRPYYGHRGRGWGHGRRW